MKSKRLLLLLLALIFAPWAANAQTVTIGTGTSAHHSAPIANYYNYSLAEMLFTSAEIGSTDVNTILSIGFEGVAASSKTYGITVYMKNVDATGFSANTDYIQVSASDVVYTGSIKPASGWNTIDLAIPFAYDNTKSLLVVVNKTSGGYDSNTSIWKYTSMSSPYMMLYGQNDSSPGVYNPTTLTSLSTSSERPNVQLTFGTPPTCFAPQNLTCTEYTATSATLTWQRHASGTETAWVLQYSTDNTFATSVQSVNVSTTPSTQLTGLTAETTYYARVRPDCDENLWSDVCEFKPTAAQTVTIGSGTGTIYYFPSNTNYDYSYTQQIYTAAEIGQIGTIKSVSFKGNSAGTRTFVVYMANTTKETFADKTYVIPIADATQVFSGSVTFTANEWKTIELAGDGFDYDGGNLAIIVDDNSGNYTMGSTNWAAFSTSGNQALYFYRDNNDIDPTIPASSNNSVTTSKNQIILSILSSNTPKPRNLQVSNLTAEEATITWEAPADNVLGYFYQYGPTGGAMTPNQSTTETSVNLQDLTPATDYTFIVHAQYADGTSDPAEISFTTEATCLPVTNITVSDITSTGAKLAWTPGGTETSWQYLTLAHGATPDWTSESVITSNTHANVPANIYACTGVQPQPNTEYDFYVRANCGGGDYSEAAMLTFRTACGAITTFPITYGFETSEGFPSNASYPTTNQLGTCWRNEATVQNGTNADRVWGTSTSYKHNGSQALVLPDKGNSTNFAKTMLVFPEMEFTNADGYVVSFWILRNGSGTNPEGFKLYVSDCDTIGPNAVELGHYSRNYGIAYPDIVSSGWYQYETAPITRTGSVYIIFEGQSYYGSATYVDDITIKEYVAVTANQIVNTVSDPATEMTWNEFAQHVNNGDHFTSSTFTLMDDITVSTMVGTSTNPFTGTFNGNSHTITVNLTATDANFTAPFRIIRNATIQNLKVNGTINDGGFKFCAGFAGDCYGNNTFTNCESAVTINATIEGAGPPGGFIARNSGGSSSSSSSLATTTFNGCAFTGKLLGANTNQSAGFCGWSEYQSPNYAKTIFTNCLFAPQEVTMSTANCATFARRRNASYVNFNNCYFMQDFNDGTNNTAQGKQAYTITGDGVNVALSGTATEYNLSGINAYATGIAYNSNIYAGEGDNVALTLSGAAGYEADHGTLVANGETFTLTMEAYNTVISGVSCPVPYNVAVPAANLTARSAQVTWDGGSEVYTVELGTPGAGSGATTVLSEGFESGSMPTGWDNSMCTNASYPWKVGTGSGNSSGTTTAATGNYNVNYYCSTASNYAYLITPSMNLANANEATLTFNYTNPAWSGGRYALTIYYRVNEGSWNQLEQYTTAQSGWTNKSVTLTGLANNYQIAFYVTGYSSDYGYGVGIDDITVSADIVQYDWTEVSDNATSPYTIEGLEPETTYAVRVKGICAGVPTDYSDVVEFTTPATCPAPTMLAVTDGSVTAHAATITWTENGEATTWIVEYADNADFTNASAETVEDDATYSFDELDGETTYYVRVKAHCGENDESDYSNVVNFTTLVACQAPTVLTMTATTTTTATLSWTENGTATAWQICLNGDETNLIAANTNPFILEGLTAATAYTAKVRANCGGIDGESAWSNTVNFATECDAITTFPWMVDFESFTNETVPNCWDNSASTTSTLSGNPQRVWGVYTYGENKMIRMYNYLVQVGTALINTPDLVLPANAEYNLTFDYSHTASCGDFIVKVSEDGGTTFTNLATYSKEGSSTSSTDPGEFTPATISLAAYAGKTIRLQFFANANFGSGAIFVDNVTITPVFTKRIIGYDTEEGNGFNYYLIASPLANDVNPTTVNMITDEYGTEVNPETSTYDLYRFDESEDLEWVNYRESSFNLVNGQGYLYASKEGTTITFTGTPYTGTTKTVTLSKTEAAPGLDFPGWNLVGNPFTVEAYIGRPFYRMDTDGARVLAEEQTGAIQLMEGVFVIANNDGEEMTFSTEAPGAKASIALNLTQGRGNTIDRAIVSVGQGQTLPKFMFNPYDTKLYIPQNGEDYAVVRGRVSDEIPVSFVPAEDGYYNISVDVRNMNLRSLMLKDNVRNVSIDLLRTPTYQFKASVYDRADRFILMFRTSNSIYKEKIVKGGNPDDFSFYSNGVFVIDNEGEATLQVIDLNGHILRSETINGSTSIQVDAAPGIYMLRLVNGDNVKVQKVVVK